MLSEKIVERLSIYRRTLLKIKKEDRNKLTIFSHELAKLMNNTPAQVRRDFMNLGHSGVPRKGYNINQLLNCFSRILDKEETRYIAVAGMGNLGLAVMNYFIDKRAKLKISACFDVDEKKIGEKFGNVICSDLNQLEKIIESKNIKIGVITTPGSAAQEVACRMVKAGVVSLVNFTTIQLIVPDNVFVERVDIAVSLEKAAYFS